MNRADFGFDEENNEVDTIKEIITSSLGDRDPNDFETEYEVITPTGMKRSDTRYIFFAGDVIEDALKRQRKEFHLGGEYFGQDFPGLGINKHFLERGRITPLTLRPRPTSSDELISNREVEAFEGIVRLPQGEVLSPRLIHTKVFPGDQLDGIVHGSRSGGGKGYVEITTFAKMDYNEETYKGSKVYPVRRLINSIQDKIFPGWNDILVGKKLLPVTLREFQELIMRARDKYASDDLVTTTCTEMLESCAQFRLWGMAYLQREAIRTRAGVHQQGGYVHTYSSVAEVLLRQLEIKRESVLEAPAPPKEVTQSSDRMADAVFAMVENQSKALEQNQTLVNFIMSKGLEIPADVKEAIETAPAVVLPEETKEKTAETVQNAQNGEIAPNISETESAQNAQKESEGKQRTDQTENKTAAGSTGAEGENQNKKQPAFRPNNRPVNNPAK